MAPRLAELCFEADSSVPILVPVPLHRWRLWQRGFNQSAELARQLAQRTGLHMIPDLLLRTRPTPSLRGLGRAERARAVRHAFAVNPRHSEVLRGAHIVLVDDVLTSGATADACTLALMGGGAAKVDLAIFARVFGEGEESWSDVDSHRFDSDMTI
jgi:predicted amidophosphoribosyltransferase